MYVLKETVFGWMEYGSDVVISETSLVCRNSTVGAFSHSYRSLYNISSPTPSLPQNDSSLSFPRMVALPVTDFV